MRPERNTQPQPRSHHPLCWEASLWGRRVRCHDLDRHVYLDGRFLDLTPIEFCLFRLLLQQAIEARSFAEPESLPPSAPRRYLQQVGIVPTGALLIALTSDPGSLVSLFSSGDHGRSGNETAHPLTGPLNSPRSGRSSTYRTSSGRASLASHLDRLRGKLRCHGLEVGTVILFGRSAQGYMLLPQEDGFYEEG